MKEMERPLLDTEQKSRNNNRRNTSTQLRFGDDENILMMLDNKTNKYSTIDIGDKTIVIFGKNNSLRNSLTKMNPDPVIYDKRSVRRGFSEMKRKKRTLLPKVGRKMPLNLTTKKNTFQPRMRIFKNWMRKKQNLHMRNIIKTKSFLNRSLENSKTSETRKSIFKTPLHNLN